MNPKSFSVEKFNTKLNKNGIYVYRNYEHYRKTTMSVEEYYKYKAREMNMRGLSWQVRELINDAREKTNQKEEYQRQSQERKNKYPHLFNERSENDR